MELSVFEVIQAPMMSEKSSKLMDTQKKISLRVHPAANKVMVKEALEVLFKVRVKDVNIIVRKGKVRQFKRRASQGPLRKIAIVTLKDEESFAILTQAGAGGAVSAQVSSGSEHQVTDKE